MLYYDIFTKRSNKTLSGRLTNCLNFFLRSILFVLKVWLFIVLMCIVAGVIIGLVLSIPILFIIWLITGEFYFVDILDKVGVPLSRMMEKIFPLND